MPRIVVELDFESPCSPDLPSVIAAKAKEALANAIGGKPVIARGVFTTLYKEPSRAS